MSLFPHSVSPHAYPLARCLIMTVSVCPLAASEDVIVALEPPAAPHPLPANVPTATPATIRIRRRLTLALRRGATPSPRVRDTSALLPPFAVPARRLIRAPHLRARLTWARRTTRRRTG